MAIGTAGAIIGSAVIGAGASYLGGKAQGKAAGKAADISLQANRENNQLARDVYGWNAARLDPTAARGLQAGNALSSLLGLPSQTNGNAPGIPGTGALGGGGAGSGPVDPAWAQQAATALLPHLQNTANPNRGYHQAYQSYAQSNPIKYTADGKVDPTWAVGLWNAVGNTVQATANSNPNRDISQAFGGLGPIAYAQQTTPATGTPAAGGQTPQQAATAGFDAFRNSTNYQWRFNEGSKALQLSALGGGGFDSGATRKALTEYGQNYASNELGNYMDRLAQQQQFGLGAASALAGVSQNMVSQVSANNNMGAAAAGNAALVQGQANANMWGGIGNSIGTAIGALGSSYGGGGAQGNWARGQWG